MAGTLKIKWRVKGFEELRKQPGVVADLKARAEKIAAACGDGYEASAEVGAHRARSSVLTADIAAIVDNASNQTLLRNLDHGR